MKRLLMVLTAATLVLTALPAAAHVTSSVTVYAPEEGDPPVTGISTHSSLSTQCAVGKDRQTFLYGTFLDDWSQDGAGIVRDRTVSTDHETKTKTNAKVISEEDGRTRILTMWIGNRGKSGVWSHATDVVSKSFFSTNGRVVLELGHGSCKLRPV